ncbi:catalase family protein [Devosia sp. MSA67]|uniref:Catalase family protein n=1 Tax=Devosia sediminis TaxID=2798801 RepID=A0A934J0Q9_9HYPH|nr:catalase family protein [Devosia sediminis]
MPPRSPQIYSPELEVIEPDEAQLARELAETMLSISRKVHEDSGHAERSVHAKSHGLLTARLDVLPDLPEALAQGLFARPASHDCILRFSTIPGDILPDTVSTPRGVAIKVLDVGGARLPGSEDDSVQDFILVNGKQFSAPNARAFLANLKLLASTTDKAEGLKVVLSGALRGLEKAVEAVGGQSAVLKALGGEPERHILGESYFSQLALRHGKYIAKLALVPVSDNLKALTGELVDIGHDDDAIRSAVENFFARETGVWELQAQLCSDIATMPIEDAAAQWDEAISPFTSVASITARPQPAWSPGRSQAVDERMGFSPWHGIEDHRPLGSIMRLRRLAYAEAQRFRARANGVEVASSPSLADIPGEA